MNLPESFAEWCDLFDDFKNRLHDEEILKAASMAKFDDTPIVAEMWTNEYLSAINDRIRIAQKRFDRDMTYAKGNEADIYRALTALKRELKYIYKFADIPCCKEVEGLKDTKNIVLQAANTIENSLTESAKADRSGKLSGLIKSIKLSDIA